jgi:hypothetical protein
MHNGRLETPSIFEFLIFRFHSIDFRKSHAA